MDYDEGTDTSMSRELLEEMLWVFRAEDASPWNYAILTLTFIVIVISFVLLGRSILANRNRKLQQQGGAPTLAVRHLPETRDKDDIQAHEETELKEKEVSSIFFPDTPESET